MLWYHFQIKCTTLRGTQFLPPVIEFPKKLPMPLAWGSATNVNLTLEFWGFPDPKQSPAMLFSFTVFVNVCSTCMCKCIQYVYVCVDADVYVSLPPCGCGGGWGGVIFLHLQKRIIFLLLRQNVFFVSTFFFDFECFLFDLLDGISFGLLTCVLVLHTGIWIPFQTTFS